METVRLPEKWQEWKLVERLGEGGDGSVYKAERGENGWKEYCAIKIIESSNSIEEIKLMNELKGASNVVFIEDYFVEETSDEDIWKIYIKMELLQNLTSYVKNHDIKEQDVVAIGIDICKALEHCRKTNIVHSDIKEDNIFVSRNGEYKLGDFGVSEKMTTGKSRYLQKGTLYYMAPEVYGAEFTEQSDLYSLGITLYRLLNTDPAVFSMKNGEYVVREKFPELENVSEEMNRIILKLCQYDPKKRYQTAAEVRAELEKIYIPKISENKKTQENKKAQNNKKKILIGFAMAVGLLLTIGGIYYISERHQQTKMVEIIR